NMVPAPRIYFDSPIVADGNAHIRWEAFSYKCREPFEEIQVRYRIDGRPWSPWSTARDYTIRELSPGDHAFTVQSTSMFGSLPQELASVSLSIPHPFSQLPAFVIPVGALSLFVIALSIDQVRRRRKHGREIRASEAKFRRLTEATFEGV